MRGVVVTYRTKKWSSGKGCRWSESESESILFTTNSKRQEKKAVEVQVVKLSVSLYTFGEAGHRKCISASHKKGAEKALIRFNRIIVVSDYVTLGMFMFLKSQV